MPRWRVWKMRGYWHGQQYGTPFAVQCGMRPTLVFIIIKQIEGGADVKNYGYVANDLPLPDSHCPECQKPTRWDEPKQLVRMSGGASYVHYCHHCHNMEVVSV